MATDQHDKQTRSLPLQRRGRPSIGDAPMTPAERKRVERQRRRERGEVCMWLSAEEAAMVQRMRSGCVGYGDPSEHDDLREEEVRQRFLAVRPDWMNGLSERAARALFENVPECTLERLKALLDQGFEFERLPNVGRRVAVEIRQWIKGQLGQ